MARKSKQIVWPHLNDCNGDVTKKWYVEFTVTTPTGKKVRNRIYEGFEKLNTAKERHSFSQKIVSEYTEKLKSGWRPFDPDIVEYEYMLEYHNKITFSGKKKKKASYIEPLFSEYLKYKKPSINKSSLDDYRSKLRQLSLYLEDVNLLNKDLSSFNNEIIINFLRVMAEDKGRARKTILKYQQVIFDFFNFIRKVKKINIPNPIDDDIPRLGGRFKFAGGRQIY